jgi:hypothetical protein
MQQRIMDEGVNWCFCAVVCLWIQPRPFKVYGHWIEIRFVIP